MWLGNKTAENMRRWIASLHVFVATDGEAVIGVAAMTSSGEVVLLYVAPAARFRGISKALLASLEAKACELAVETIALQSTKTARQFYLSVGYGEDGPETKGFGITFCYPMTKRLAGKRNRDARDAG